MERKNIKRNSTRPSLKEKGLVSSLQRRYSPNGGTADVELRHSNYRFLPKGSKTPHLQGTKEGKNSYWFVISLLDKDSIAVCSGIKECYFFINRGYYCKKHG